jgi:hypothetical protein
LKRFHKNDAHIGDRKTVQAAQNPSGNSTCTDGDERQGNKYILFHQLYKSIGLIV